MMGSIKINIIHKSIKTAFERIHSGVFLSINFNERIIYYYLP